MSHNFLCSNPVYSLSILYFKFKYIGQNKLKSFKRAKEAQKLNVKFHTFYPKIYLFYPKNHFFLTIQRRLKGGGNDFSRKYTPLSNLPNILQSINTAISSDRNQNLHYQSKILIDNHKIVTSVLFIYITSRFLYNGIHVNIREGEWRGGGQKQALFKNTRLRTFC